jgi:hypothetical protein
MFCLQTYFVPEEGFLAGLALNNENVTFNKEYKNVLRFYGFDLENDQLPTLSPENATTTATPAGAAGAKDETTTFTTMKEDKAGGQDSTTMAMREETTLNPNAETINEIDIRGPSTTPITPTSAVNALNSQSEIPSTTTSQPPSTKKFVETSAPPTSTTQTETTTVTIDVTSTLPTTSEITTSPTPLTTESIDRNQIDMTISTVDMRTSTMSSTTSANDDTSTASTLFSGDTTVTEDAVTEPTTVPISTTTSIPDTTQADNQSTLETLERKKKSIVDFIFTNPPYIDDYLIYKSYDVGLDLPIPNFDNTMFLANGLKSVQVNYQLLYAYLFSIFVIW